MKIRWRTIPDGIVELSFDDGGTWSVPTVVDDDILMRAGMARFHTIIEDHAARTGVPSSWLYGMAYTESRFNPAAVNRRDSPAGLGILQITDPDLYLMRGFTADDMLDPDKNVQVASEVLRNHRRSSTELIVVASLYNAGGFARKDSAGKIVRDVDGHALFSPHPSTTSPFGIRETAGHILTVVRGNNAAILITRSTTEPSFDVGAVLALQAATLKKTTEDEIDAARGVDDDEEGES